MARRNPAALPLIIVEGCACAGAVNAGQWQEEKSSMAAGLDRGLIAAILTKWHELLDSPRHTADALAVYDQEYVFADRASSVLARVGLCTFDLGPRIDWEPPLLTLRLAAGVPPLCDEAVVALLLDSLSVAWDELAEP
jgi:hypothetical protein